MSAKKREPKIRIPKLPPLLERKRYKTGQTRGADNDQIYQNRVSRSSTVLIPFLQWPVCRPETLAKKSYEAGYIVLISPSEYFGMSDPDAELAAQGLEIGKNALVFFQLRSDWSSFNPDDLGWLVATSRLDPLGGKYVARIAATTAKSGDRINRGFVSTSEKGAGIRVYEYADSATNEECRLQLETLFWLCSDSISAAVANGMAGAEAVRRRDAKLEEASRLGLLDLSRLRRVRALNTRDATVCPLCLLELSGQSFFDRVSQAEGRAVHDLTVTEISLFHLQELRVGQLQHVPYNVGWGHHHCNVVVKDSGIENTVQWLRSVVKRNDSLKTCPPETA